MDLSNIVKPECCDLNLKQKHKEPTLKEIAKILKKSDEFKNITKEEIYKALLNRERKGTTGFGNSIAIPHCQLENLENFVISVTINKKGAYFESLDKKKVKIFVTIVGPKGKSNMHLKLLAKVSQILKDKNTINKLLQSESKIALYEEFLRQSTEDLKIKPEKAKDKAVLFIVQDEDIMDDITEIFVEFGIQKATIIDAVEMHNLISNLPLFMGFFDFTGEKNKFNKLILTKLNENYIKAIVNSIENVVGNLDNYSGLSIVVINIFFAKGF